MSVDRWVPAEQIAREVAVATDLLSSGKPELFATLQAFSDSLLTAR